MQIFNCMGFIAGVALLSNVFIFPLEGYPPEAELESYYVDMNRWHLEISDEDIDWLYAIVSHEAEYCGTKEKQAIAEVVLNRVYSSSFPNTITGVLFSPGQFCSKEELERMRPSAETKEIVNKLIHNESEYVLSMYAYYFQNFPTYYKDEIQIGKQYFRRNP